MTTRLDVLLDGQYEVQPFAALPASYQLAIVWFMAVDGDAWDGVDLPVMTEESMKPLLAERMPEFVRLYGDTLFGTARLCTRAVQAAVMQDEEISEAFSNWEQYHADYARHGVPAHPASGRWPVILSDDDSETLRDGWHRFHSYVRGGAAVIPAVFFP